MKPNKKRLYNNIAPRPIICKTYYLLFKKQSEVHHPPQEFLKPHVSCVNIKRSEPLLARYLVLSFSGITR
jgi:hypothetical protein